MVLATTKKERQGRGFGLMGEGQYVVGIEPSTNTFGRDQARQAGELIVLQPGEKRKYDLEAGVLDGEEAIQVFQARVDDLRV